MAGALMRPTIVVVGGLLLCLAACGPAGKSRGRSVLGRGVTRFPEDVDFRSGPRTGQPRRTVVLWSRSCFVIRGGGSHGSGTWRIEGEKLILREERVNGTPIPEELRKDRVFRGAADGEALTFYPYVLNPWGR